MLSYVEAYTHRVSLDAFKRRIIFRLVRAFPKRGHDLLIERRTDPSGTHAESSEGPMAGASRLTVMPLLRDRVTGKRLLPAASAKQSGVSYRVP